MNDPIDEKQAERDLRDFLPWLSALDSFNLPLHIMRLNAQEFVTDDEIHRPTDFSKVAPPWDEKENE